MSRSSPRPQSSTDSPMGATQHAVPQVAIANLAIWRSSFPFGFPLVPRPHDFVIFPAGLDVPEPVLSLSKDLVFETWETTYLRGRATSPFDDVRPPTVARPEGGFQQRIEVSLQMTYRSLYYTCWSYRDRNAHRTVAPHGPKPVENQTTSPFRIPAYRDRRRSPHCVRAQGIYERDRG